MTEMPLTGLELAVLVPLFGAAFVSRLGDPRMASRWCLVFSGLALFCATVACVGFYLRQGADPVGAGLIAKLTGQPVLTLDGLNAPLFPMVALLHFLTSL